MDPERTGLGHLQRSTRGVSAFADLEARVMDIAVIPSEDTPSRFRRQRVCDEDFVVAIRASHRFAGALDLERYCEMQHLVVSLNGDPYGFIDRLLEVEG
jgi:DNA-binding transcriptional LysR family regulator